MAESEYKLGFFSLVRAMRYGYGQYDMKESRVKRRMKLKYILTKMVCITLQQKFGGSVVIPALCRYNRRTYIFSRYSRPYMPSGHTHGHRRSTSFYFLKIMMANN